MTISFGSGQASGLPLVVTALTLGTGQTIHTAVAGAGTPQRIRISALNLDPVNIHTLFIGVFATGQSVPVFTYKIALPINEGQLPALFPNLQAVLQELILNGASFITVWADTASKIAVGASVNDQNGVAAVTFGSGQTSGLPLLIPSVFVVGTLPVLNNGTLIHTAPAGAATPSIVRLSGFNLDTVGRHAAIGIFALGATVPTVAWQIALPVSEGAQQIVDPLGMTELVLNGGSFIQAWGTVANIIALQANVTTQVGSPSGATVAQAISSGLVAAVQNASRFAVGAQGGTGQATESNAQMIAPGPGVVQKLLAVSSAAIGAGASITAALRINGVTTTQSVTLTNANGTNVVTTTGAAAVLAKGDLWDFIVQETLNVAPAANILVGAELVLSG